MQLCFYLISYFIFISLFKEENLQVCGPKNPKNFKDCNEESNSDSSCCYASLSLLNENKKLCLLVPNSQLFMTPYITAMDVGLGKKNLLKMNIDCNITLKNETNVPFSVCGENTPLTPQDCFNYSTTNASCCYIESPDGKSVCLWNDGIYKIDTKYFGTRIACKEFFLKDKLRFINILVIFSFLLCLL